MSSRIDRTGTRSGRLTVTGLNSRVQDAKGDWSSYWNCVCDCGNLSVVEGSSLTGATQSCGCLRIEAIFQTGYKHGASGTREHWIWKALKGRCENPKNKKYSNYGGRGIKVCDRWRDSFENFISDMGPRPSLKHSVERIDVNGNYEPSNCKWGTVKEQANNKRSTIRIQYDGKDLTLSEWADVVGISSETLDSRMRKGWSPEKILATPLMLHNVTYLGETLPISKWSERFGINHRTIYKRLKHGWDIETALTKPSQMRPRL